MERVQCSYAFIHIKIVTFQHDLLHRQAEVGMQQNVVLEVIVQVNGWLCLMQIRKYNNNCDVYTYASANIYIALT